MTDTLVFARMSVQNRMTLVSLYLQDQKPVEIRIHPTGRLSVLGNIYVGRIENLKKNIGAAFVRFQEDQTGFLPVPDACGWKEGDLLLVQVEKEAMKQKLPRLTTNLTLTGRWMVLGTDRPGLYFSRKLSEEQRKNLRESFRPLTQEWPGRELSRFSVILRTNAPEASPEDLAEEYRKLSAELSRILQNGPSRTLYSCLHQADADWMELFKQYADRDNCQVVTDDPEIYRTLTEMQQETSQRVPLRLYQDSMVELYRLYNLSTVLAALNSKTVFLKSGGFLVIEETEAFTAVDVNTGRDSGKKTREETVRKTNLEAVEEIASQIRLRQLSGTILVDFINDSRPGAAEELMDAMKLAVRRDPVPPCVIDMTPLYIMEMTRKKRFRSWTEQYRRIMEG